MTVKIKLLKRPNNFILKILEITFHLNIFQTKHQMNFLSNYRKSSNNAPGILPKGMKHRFHGQFKQEPNETNKDNYL